MSSLPLSPTGNPKLDDAIALIFESMEFESKFVEWLCDNWEIYEKFEQIANDLWSHGVKHYGSKGIWEVIRYHTAISENGGKFKINNNWHPHAARLYLLRHPSRKDFFTLRERISRRGIPKESNRESIANVLNMRNSKG